MQTQFNYAQAFSRNLGLVTPQEQEKLRQSTVAIAGLGGVGGGHLLTLAHLGVGKFHIADMDSFDLPNFNRQAGANMSTLGLAKTEVMKAEALKINPEIQFKVFPTGVDDNNIDDFLDGVDVFVDGFDAFVLDIRRKVFMACRQKGISAITAGPLGMSTAMVHFSPTSMSFDDYFAFGETSQLEKTIRFILGIAPSLIHFKAVVAPEYLNLLQQRGPSTAMGCMLASGVMGTEVMKVLLKRGKVLPSPWSHQWDSYTLQYKRNYMWAGAKNPLFRLKLAIGLRKYRKPQ